MHISSTVIEFVNVLAKLNYQFLFKYYEFLFLFHNFNLDKMLKVKLKKKLTARYDIKKIEKISNSVHRNPLKLI